MANPDDLVFAPPRRRFLRDSLQLYLLRRVGGRQGMENESRSRGARALPRRGDHALDRLQSQ